MNELYVIPENWITAPILKSIGNIDKFMVFEDESFDSAANHVMADSRTMADANFDCG